MNEILIATKIIDKIQNESTPSSVLMRNYFLSHFCPRETRKTIQTLVMKTFANWYVFNAIVKDSFPKIREEEILVLCVGLANTVFVHAFSADDTIEKVIDALAVDHQLSLSMIETIFHHEYQKQNLVPSYVDHQSNEYYHLRYNIPLWLVEMWNRHYGKTVSYRMIASLKQKPLRSFRVNEKIIKRRELLEKYPAELVSGISETTVHYRGNRPTSKLDFYRRGEGIMIAEGSNHAINKIPLHSLDNVLVVAEQHSSLPLALLGRFKGTEQMLYALLNNSETLKAKKDIEKYHFSNVEVIESSLSLLLTYISYPQDIVMVVPPSSRFQYIKTEYDFFVHFKRDDLDRIINMQYSYLEECASFVKESGHLIYLVETANNKEGSLQIRRFLQNHDDFSLVEERQMLPLDRRQTMCYFAFLKKEASHHD